MIRVEQYKKISQFTTFGVGGRARYFCEVNNTSALIEAIVWAEQRALNWRILAGGSNVVLRDGVIPGLCIHVVGGEITRVRGAVYYVDAGVPLARLIAYTVSRGLSGLESLSGIPGTVGGATVGNAGAYGHSIEECVRRVRIWDGKEIRWISKKACAFQYRESIFKHASWIVLGVELLFKEEDKKKLLSISKNIIAERIKKYPQGLRCPGSYFKNVLVSTISRATIKKIDTQKIVGGKIPAGYLLEVVGAKDTRRGGVCVASYHGNLIMNTGKGTAKDARALARVLKGRVQKKFGIALEEEVRYF